MTTQHHGFPHREHAPPPPDPATRALLPWNPEQPAVVVSATPTTAEVWTTTIPTSATIAAWEAATGRRVAVVHTNTLVMTALAAAHNDPTSHTPLADVITDAEASLPQFGTSAWPSVQRIVLTAGQKGWATAIDGTTTRLHGGEWTSEALTDLQRTWGITESRRRVPVRSEHISGELISASNTVVYLTHPTAYPGAGAIGLPEETSTWTATGGIIVVGSAATGGRTHLATAIGEYAAARRNGRAAWVGPTPPWPAPEEFTVWPHHVDSVTDAITAGSAAIVIDDLPSEQPHNKVWESAAVAAMAGAIVIITVRTSTLPQLTSLVAAAGTPIVGAVVRTLIPRLGNFSVAIDDTLTVTTALARWQQAGPGRDLHYGRDLFGSSAGTDYDTALHRAVRAGELTAAEAAGWIRRADRYHDLAGILTETPAQPQAWDWPERAQPMLPHR